MTEALASRRKMLVSTANDLRQWAASQHLLGGGGFAAAENQERASSAARGFSADSIGVMQKARLTGFSVNAVTNTIYILGNAKLTKKLQEALPKSLQNGTTVAYAQARSITIGDRPDASNFGVQHSFTQHGRFSCGASISAANDRSAGTLGCLVRGKDGLFGLSNNHVSGGCSYLPIDMPILAPGVLDVIAGGPTPLAIGTHHAVLSMVAGDPALVDAANNCDAALFRISDGSSISSGQRAHYDTPTRILEPVEGMQVEKVGRTTDRTEGVIHSFVSGFQAVRYKQVVSISSDEELPINFVVSFPNVWLVKGKGRPFSQPGGSGSLIVARDAKKDRVAVGLLFAGDDDFTYMLEIGPILERFGVQLVGDHNFV